MSRYSNPHMEISDLEKRFKTVEKTLKLQSWISKADWIVSQHPFPRRTPMELPYMFIRNIGSMKSISEIILNPF